MNEIDLTDIYSTFHAKRKEYNFSTTHGTFYRTDHVIGHKTALNQYKMNKDFLEYNENVDKTFPNL